MRTLLAIAALLLPVMTVACSSDEATPALPCRPEASTLSSIDPSSGTTLWSTTLAGASEQPLRVEGGSVTVSGPCGKAAVVSLGSGAIRYDDAHAGDVVGTLGDRLFQRGSAADGWPSIDVVDMITGDTTERFVSKPRPDLAAVMDGSLITLLGGELRADDLSGSGPSWTTDISAAGGAKLMRSGPLALITTSDESTFAVRLADGALVWRTVPPIPQSYLSQIVGTARVVLTAAFSTDDTSPSVVYATDAGSGRLLWSRPALTVVAADPHVTVLRARSSVMAVDTTTGALLWRRTDQEIEQPTEAPAVAAISGHVVALGGRQGLPVLGLDRDSGRVLWRGPAVLQTLAVGRTLVAVTVDADHAKSAVTAIDPRTGGIEWSRRVRRGGVELAAAPGGRLLILDTDRVDHMVE